MKKDSVWKIGTYIFLGCIFILMPILFRDHYYMMASIKWNFSGTCMILFVLFSGICAMCRFLKNIMTVEEKAEKNKRKSKKKPEKKQSTFLLSDLFVLLYLVSCILTFSGSENQMAAWMGTDGWYMGTITQLLLILIYWAVSRGELSMPVTMGICLGGTVLPSVVAIGQRIGNDFLHLYWEMPDEVQRDYISTIGNRTWFSGYICCVFPLALWIFMVGEKLWVRACSGIVIFLSYACLILTYSDSGYAALAAVIYAAGILGLRDKECLKNWLWTLLMLPLAGITAAVLRMLSSGLVREARGLGKLFLDLRLMLPLAIVLVGIIAVFSGEKGEKRLETLGAVLRKRIRLLIALPFGAVVLLILLIACNTAGVLPVTIDNSLLLFNGMWGDGRGIIWPMTLKMYAETSFAVKIFGVGHDCYAWHVYSNEAYAEFFRRYWGDAIMANAHNEWLNAMLCSGLFGALTYGGIFVSSIVTVLKKFKDNGRHYAVGIVLCIVGYMTHNFFCYQQITAVVPMFVLMGIAAGSARNACK